MQIHRRLRQGIFLITTMLLVTLLVMMATAIFVSTQIGFAMSGSLSNRELAKHAALNGLNFIQAQLETNCSGLAPSPDGKAASVTINAADGAMVVVEQGWNVAGWMSNANVTGAGEQPVYLMFQACFNKSYSAYSAAPTPPAVDGIQLPAASYASINNLLRPQTTAELANSYNNGVAYQSVPGETADVIVTGYVVGPDGTVLSSRVAEAMFSVGQVGQYVPAGAVAQSDVDLQVTTGTVNVGLVGTVPGTFNGLATFAGNINTFGPLPDGAGTAPPVYDSSSKVALNGSNAFTYQGPSPAGVVTFPQDTQMGAPAPPTIAPGSLPTLNSPVNVQAGTWVVWGTPAALYHYPTDYSSVGMNNGTPVPVQNLPWTPGASGSPPSLNSVSPDQGPLTSLDGGGQLALTPSPTASTNTAGNSITIANHDVNVTPLTSGPTTINSFTLLVAPSQTSGGATISGSDATNGNAQLVFQPSGGQSSLQFRAPGTVTIMGNVSGAGSLQSTGTTSDVNVVGKSTLDARADNGVALYATGNVNVWGAVDANGNTLAQLPSSVGAYLPILQTNPQNVTGSTPVPVVSTPAATQWLTNIEYSANMAADSYNAPPPGTTTSPSPAGVSAGTSYNAGTYIVNIDPNGTTSSSQLVSMATNAGSAATWDGGIYPDAFNALLPAMTAYQQGNKAQAQTLFAQVLLQMGFTTTDGVNYTISVSQANSVTTTGGPLVAPSASPSASPSSGPLPSFDQSFNGLVYAADNFNANTNGAMTVNGGLISNTGTITIDSSNITINYNATAVGQFAGLFGDRVLLHRNTVTVY